MQEAKRGDRVSLNTLKRLFYFQEGIGGITLVSGSQESAVIPDNATDKHLQQINHAIKVGQLNLGFPEKNVDMPDRDSDIKIILEAGRSKIDEWLFKLRGDTKVKNELKISTLEKLIEFEKLGKNRKSVIARAEVALNSIGGVSPVVETDQEKVEIKLTPQEVVTDEPEKTVEINRG